MNQIPNIEEEFWQMMRQNQFVKSTNSVTDEVETFAPAIVDMEATMSINGEFDKYAIDKWLHQQLQKAREQNGKRNAIVKEYKDEGVMFILKVEDGKTYEASMPIPKWGEVGKLQLRDHSELDQDTTPGVHTTTYCNGEPCTCGPNI